jgi:glycine betaine catabolism B
MLPFLRNILNNLTMYQAMLYLLRGLIATAAILSFFGILPYVWWHILLELAYLIVACVAFNWIFAKIFRAKPHYESQYITAEILTLIVGPATIRQDWIMLTIIAAVAMGSKYILAWNKRHIFNPAAIAVVFSALFLAQGASWWVGNQYLVAFVLVGGLLVVHKLKWFYLTNSFLATYLIGLTAITLLQGGNLPFAYQVLLTTILNSALLFFTFVMLIEPLTAPASRRLKICYGIFIALAILVYQSYFNLYYGFELGLITGNLAAFLVSRNPRLSLILVGKQEIAKNTVLFEFEPIKPFNFIPGQFMEWTLPHAKADSRGTRRFFSIASSPTEPTIKLLTKFNEKGSTFKKALNELQPGGEITASHLDGDFILPENEKAKYVLIAGGTGIAPYYSMISYLIDKKIKKDIMLFYTSKTDEELALKEFWNQASGVGVKSDYVITERDGYITPELIKARLPDWKERIYYISGPEPMVETYVNMLLEIGIDKNKIRTDYFPGYTETYSKK